MTEKMKFSHPPIKDLYLVIITIKEKEIPLTMNTLEEAVSVFTESCQLKRVPAWIYDLKTGKVVMSADKIGQILTPHQIDDQYKPNLTISDNE